MPQNVGIRDDKPAKMMLDRDIAMLVLNEDFAQYRAVDRSKVVGEWSDKYSRTFWRTNWINQEIPQPK